MRKQQSVLFGVLVAGAMCCAAATSHARPKKNPAVPATKKPFVDETAVSCASRMPWETLLAARPYLADGLPVDDYPAFAALSDRYECRWGDGAALNSPGERLCETDTPECREGAWDDVQAALTKAGDRCAAERVSAKIIGVTNNRGDRSGIVMPSSQPYFEGLWRCEVEGTNYEPACEQARARFESVWVWFERMCPACRRQTEPREACKQAFGALDPERQDCERRYVPARAAMMKECGDVVRAFRPAPKAASPVATTIPAPPVTAARQCAPAPKPTCTYDDLGPGDFTCQVKGCASVALEGVRVGRDDTDPCSYWGSIQHELQATRDLACDETPKACRQRDQCLDLMSRAVTADHDACACRHPEPGGVRSTMSCRSKRWGEDQGLFGDRNACVPAKPSP